MPTKVKARPGAKQPRIAFLNVFRNSFCNSLIFGFWGVLGTACSSPESSKSAELAPPPAATAIPPLSSAPEGEEARPATVPGNQPSGIPPERIPSPPTTHSNVLPPEIPNLPLPSPRAVSVLPVDLGNLREQARLWLNSVGIEMSPEALQETEVLDLSARGLASLPLAALSTLPKLRELNLQRNSLREIDLSQLSSAGFESLKVVNLSCSLSPLPASVIEALGRTAPGILALNLESTGLQGFPRSAIPLSSGLSVLSEFVRLVSLSVGNTSAPDQYCPHPNSLSADMGLALASIKTLQWLNASYSNYDAQFVTPLSALPHLEKFEAQDNGFVDDAFLAATAQLKALTHLDVSFRAIKVTDVQASRKVTLQGIQTLTQVSPLTSLREFRIAGTRAFSKYALPAEALSALSALTQLRILDLSFSLANTTETELAALGTLGNLESLFLAKNFTQSALFFNMKFAEGLPNLQELSVHGYALKDDDLKILGTRTQLKNLTVGSVELGVNNGLEFLVPLQNLERLDFSESPMATHDLAPLAKLPKLTHLALMTGVQKQYDQIPLLKGLTSLTLASVWQSDAELAFLPLMPQLRELSIGNTKESCAGFIWVTCASDATLIQIGNLPEMTLLRMNGTAISSEGLRPLARLSKLESLDVRNSPKISGTASEILKSFPALKDLALTNTGVSAPEIVQLALDIFRLETLVAGQFSATENTQFGARSRVQLKPEESPLSW